MACLIALEGIDGSGKGTQAALLQRRLQERLVSSAVLSFPRYRETRFGEAIGDFLNGRFGSLQDVHPQLAAALFAGDRFESRDVIVSALERKDVLICDRYVASNVAHQAAKLDGAERDELASWIERIEFEVYRLPRPQMTILLDVPVDVAQDLIAQKGARSYTSASADLQEADAAYLDRVRNVYRQLVEGRSDWTVIECVSSSGLRPAEEIAEELLQIVLRILGRVAGRQSLAQVMNDATKLTTGEDVRRACRAGLWTQPTVGLAPGFAQANLVVVPQDVASNFLLFCQRNSQACPVLEVTEAGDPIPRASAPQGDLRTDLPRYRIWQHGELLAEPTDVTGCWRSDLVSFLIGCSFTFDSLLLQAGFDVRHLSQSRNVPMYRTSLPCRSAGVFRGPLVVSMRPFPHQHVPRVQALTSRYPRCHGGPVHVGDPAQIGIEQLSVPDFGDAVEIRAGEVPVFWACGVTPQCALAEARIPCAITHSPGCMFVTDLREVGLLPDEPGDQS